VRGSLRTITAPDGGMVTYSYDGSLLTDTTWSGAVAGAIHRTYSNDFLNTSESVNSGNTLSFGYDQDNLLTQAGTLMLSRDPRNGLFTGSTLGSVTDTLSYNSFGEISAYEVFSGGTTLFSTQNTRDDVSRIVQSIETIGGATHTDTYTYDVAGRLTEVRRDGILVAEYSYDANGNRLSYTGSGGAISGTYDNQDRLLQYGTMVYTYTANGELQSKTDTATAQTSMYNYDALGNLITATLPDGTQIAYIIDGTNRRIGKKVNGTLVQGFLYKDQLNPIAELDGTNNVVARFIYASRDNVPDYMVKNGTIYRIISDHLGSPRLVVDVATGQIVQRMDYDAFGIITLDTNPGFQPFGFAGGIYDQQTQLVRFGSRDYDAQTGRWTAKDSRLFSGGDTNLYGYVLNDPINLRDPNGQDALEAFWERVWNWYKGYKRGKKCYKGGKGVVDTAEANQKENNGLDTAAKALGTGLVFCPLPGCGALSDLPSSALRVGVNATERVKRDPDKAICQIPNSNPNSSCP
jgi:RHS repeat-associated protein